MPQAEPWTAERASEFFDYEAQPKEHVGVCDLCGSCLTPEVVAEGDRYGFPVRHVGCRDCELVFQSPRLAPAGLRALYSGPDRALVSAWHGRPINRETLEPEQAGYARALGDTFERLWMRGAEKPLPGVRVLDLGGSTGIVGASIAARLVSRKAGGGTLTVVEPSCEEAVAAIPRAARVVVQSAEDFEAELGSFDLVLLCQTVDHLRSISAVLRKVRTWLAPGGRFFVDAVDWEKVRGDGPAHDALKIDHVYALTPTTMRRYLETHGFVAREVEAPSANHVAFLCEVAE
jgi:SAM-dependent methyltransferase